MFRTPIVWILASILGAASPAYGSRIDAFLQIDGIAGDTDLKCTSPDCRFDIDTLHYLIAEPDGDTVLSPLVFTAQATDAGLAFLQRLQDAGVPVRATLGDAAGEWRDDIWVDGRIITADSQAALDPHRFTFTLDGVDATTIHWRPRNDDGSFAEVRRGEWILDHKPTFSGDPSVIDGLIAFGAERLPNGDLLLAVVPEPGTWALWLAGLASLVALLRAGGKVSPRRAKRVVEVLPPARFAGRPMSRKALFLAGTGLLAVVTALPVASREPGLSPQALAERLPPGTLRLYLKLKGQAVPDESDAVPDTERPDPALLTITLPQVMDQIRNVICCHPAPSPLLPPLQTALDAFTQADAELTAGSADASPRHFHGVLTHMAAGQRALDQALDIAAAIDPSAIALLVPAVQKVRDAARRMNRVMIDLALAAGVSPGRLAPAEEALRLGDAAHAAGDYGAAIDHYGDGLDIATGTVLFSMDRFEQNLRSVFDSNTVGWAYALSQGGLLARSDANGQARTAAEPRPKLQSPTRKMHMASVSKTLTAIATLRLLADKGLSPDAAIDPYLPSNWARGTGVEAITFREVMTHRSGFGQLPPGGSAFDKLQTMVGIGVADKSFNYDNANFGLLRVLTARLLGVDVGSPAFQMADAGALTSALFLSWAQPLYASAGVNFTCDPSTASPTVEYQFPDTGNPGYAETPMSLACGGFGTFMSARELASALAFLRYSGTLMSPASYQAMKSGHLGFMNVDDGYGFAQGVFGSYYTHGGDWDQSAGGLDTCFMIFPINVEASVVVNSSRKTSGIGYPNGGYQCSVIKWAFENAWIPQ